MRKIDFKNKSVDDLITKNYHFDILISWLEIQLKSSEETQKQIRQELRKRNIGFMCKPNERLYSRNIQSKAWKLLKNKENLNG